MRACIVHVFVTARVLFFSYVRLRVCFFRLCVRVFSLADLLVHLFSASVLPRSVRAREGVCVMHKMLKCKDAHGDE
jgi:hypothetical protein